MSPKVTAFQGPTVSDDGTRLFHLFVPGGSGGTAIGGTSEPFQRLHAAADTDYLFRITNRGANAQQIGASVNWIETPFGD